MKFLIPTAVVLSAFQAQASDNQIQGAPYLTVGDGMSCDYSSIQSAIDSTLSNTIRIASDKAYFENITIDDRNLVLTGGYGSCEDAENNITDLSKAVIDGGDSGSVILISGNSQVRDIELRHLAIGNGDVGLASTADANITANDLVVLLNNTAGVFLFGGNNTLNMEDVLINSNSGPGVACGGSDNVFSIRGDSTISENSSSTTGGGLTIVSECDANLYAPLTVTENTANGHGGGIYVGSGSLVNLRGIDVTYNQADFDGDDDGNGGGLFVADPTSIVNAVNTTFEGNMAYSGGAVAAQDSGYFGSYAENTQNNPCSQIGQCSLFTGNSAQNRGGVLHATTEGSIKVLHAFVTGNGLLNEGLVAHASVDGSVVMEGSMIVKNGGEDLPGNSLFFVNGISGNNQATIKLNHVTVAANHVSGSVVNNFFGVFEMDASIVQDDVNVSNAVAPATHSFECVIAHETSSFSAGGTVTIDDPAFINPSANNFRLKPSSPAIDYCYSAEPLTVELGYDIDLENRDYDDPNVTNLHGTYDLGADEYRWDNDLIFMDGFDD